jgi:hypothetical protein
MITNPQFVANECIRAIGELFTNPVKVWGIVDGIGVCAYAALSELDPSSPNSIRYQSELAAGIKSAFEVVMVLYSLFRKIDRNEPNPSSNSHSNAKYEAPIPIEVKDDFPRSNPWVEPTEANLSDEFEKLLKLTTESIIVIRERMEPFLTGFGYGRSIAYDLLAYRHNKLVDKFNGIGEHDLDAELRELIEASTE